MLCCFAGAEAGAAIYTRVHFLSKLIFWCVLPIVLLTLSPGMFIRSQSDLPSGDGNCPLANNSNDNNTSDISLIFRETPVIRGELPQCNWRASMTGSCIRYPYDWHALGHDMMMDPAYGRYVGNGEASTCGDVLVCRTPYIYLFYRAIV